MAHRETPRTVSGSGPGWANTHGIPDTVTKMANDTVAVLRMSVTWVAVLWICVAALVFSTLLVVIRTYTPVPKWDYWGEVYWLKQYYAGHWHVSDLWRQHNEHRIFFPRLFFLIDWGVFKGTSVFLLVSIFLLHGRPRQAFPDVDFPDEN